MFSLEVSYYRWQLVGSCFQRFVELEHLEVARRKDLPCFKKTTYQFGSFGT